MSVYLLTFAFLSLACALLAYSQHRCTAQPSAAHKGPKAHTSQDAATAAAAAVSARRFRRRFLGVYLLVAASDWLQGPYIYTLYKDEKRLSERVVAALYATGFVSAGASASFIGALADRYGRRRFSLVFCVVYGLACVSMLADDLVALFVGRWLGGVGTTLMYSVFDSWMIAEYAAEGLEASPLGLREMFGLMSTGNGAVAILSGVVGEGVVALTGTKTAPFVLAVGCLVGAAYLIQTQWVSTGCINEAF